MRNILTYFYCRLFSAAGGMYAAFGDTGMGNDERGRPVDRKNSRDNHDDLNGEYRTIKVQKYSSCIAQLNTPFLWQNVTGGEFQLCGDMNYSGIFGIKDNTASGNQAIFQESVLVPIEPCCSSWSSATSPHRGQTAPPKESFGGCIRGVGARAGRTVLLVLVVCDEPPPGADGIRFESTPWTPGTSEGVSSEFGFRDSRNTLCPLRWSKLKLASRSQLETGGPAAKMLRVPAAPPEHFRFFPPAGTSPRTESPGAPPWLIRL